MSPPLKFRGYCRNCRAELWGKDQTFYCSRSCAASYRWKDPESRARWRASLKGRPASLTRGACAYCGSTFVPTSNRQRYCKTCAPTKGAAQRIRLYGMNQTEWNRRLIEQGGKCAVCRKRVPAVADHDHATGTPGDLLCVFCNGGLAWLENDEWRRQAEAYLARVRPGRGGGATHGQAVPVLPQDIKA